VDRKYGHRGYREAEKQERHEKKDRERKPPQGGPRGATDHLGPRTPRMVGTVTRARCSNCGAVLVAGFDPNGKCPKCRFFDTGAKFECTQPIPARISPKDAKNDCTFYEFRTTVEKDTAPTSYMQPTQTPAEAPSPARPLDARQAFENLFKK
jgi:phage FluMu protein Com